MEYPTEYILAGDIGGTKTHLATYAMRDGRLVSLADKRFLNREYHSIEDIVQVFLKETNLAIHYACFGVAGAVIHGRCRMPNLGWEIDSTSLCQIFGFSKVILLNDLAAHATGIATLSQDMFVVLNHGTPVTTGNQALIAAGTGLGEALLFYTDAGYQVSASEGGHSDFAPRNDEEIDLLRYVKEKYGRVSYERLVSGSGLCEIYSFLRDTKRFEEPAWLKERLNTETDASAVISGLAMDGESDICVAVLDQFMSIYGAAAGNLALQALATGGVYIGGGIAPKILSKFPDSDFMHAFLDKGHYSSLLSNIPVRLILQPKTALCGAALHLFSHLDPASDRACRV